MQIVPFSLEDDAEFGCVLTGCRDSWPSRWAHFAGRWEGRSGARRRVGAWSRNHLHTGVERDRVLLNTVEGQHCRLHPGRDPGLRQRAVPQEPEACYELKPRLRLAKTLG